MRSKFHTERTALSNCIGRLWLKAKEGNKTQFMIPPKMLKNSNFIWNRHLIFVFVGLKTDSGLPSCARFLLAPFTESLIFLTCRSQTIMILETRLRRPQQMLQSCTLQLPFIVLFLKESHHRWPCSIFTGSQYKDNCFSEQFMSMATEWAAWIAACKNKITALGFQNNTADCPVSLETISGKPRIWGLASGHFFSQKMVKARRLTRTAILEWHDSSKDLQQKDFENSAIQGGSWWELGFSSTT